MRVTLTHTDDLLHGIGRFDPSRRADRPWWWLPAMVLCFSSLYGAFMGSFEFDSLERFWQILFSAVKVPLLLLVTSAICLPAFVVFNTVLGLRRDLREAIQAVFAGQAGLSVALASLGPITRVWYSSVASYRGAQLFNIAMFAAAALAGHLVMLRYYRPLIRRHGAHRIMLYSWLTMYAFVGVQFGWTLRPFIGSRDMAVTFFREDAFTNAYVFVLHLILGH
ncbi:MAG: hypothetical protein KAS72_04885 [Phycisphaerales bacterium]|nr:hypothetical protein [Phycisphaerales bacterium]